MSDQVMPLERLLPPGLAANSLSHAMQRDIASTLGSFALLAAYTLVVFWLLNLRLRAHYHGENLSEAVARVAIPRGKQKVELGWEFPGLSGPVSAILEKEIRYLARSGPMLFTLLMPLVVLLIFRLAPGKSGNSAGLFAHAADLAFPVGAAYTVLILTNLIYNSFGADSVGVQFFFVSPVRFREVLIGKNLNNALVMTVEVVLVWVGATFLYGPPPLDIAVATVTGVLFALMVSFSAGNLLSVCAPKKIELGTLGRQQASGITALASIGIQAVVLGLCALALMVARAAHHIWVAAVIFAVLAGVAAVVYFVMLDRMDALVLKRRDAMLTELCRA